MKIQNRHRHILKSCEQESRHKYFSSFTYPTMKGVHDINFDDSLISYHRNLTTTEVSALKLALKRVELLVIPCLNRATKADILILCLIAPYIEGFSWFEASILHFQASFC